jgi:hypothetical protein
MNLRRNKLYTAILVSSSLGFTTLAYAVEPTALQWGPIDIVPTLGFDVMQDDNIYRTDLIEVESLITIISPRLQAIYENGGNRFNLDLEAFKGDYEETSADDYEDYRVAGDAHIEVTNRNFFDLSFVSDNTHETRGTGFSEGGNLPLKPDEYDLKQFDVSYQLGTNESVGRVVLTAGQSAKEYNNNLERTVFREVDIDNFGATFFYNLSPRTALLLEVRHSEADYTTDPETVIGGLDTLDSEEDYVFLGIEWEATSQVSGNVRIGTGEKEFDDKDRKTIDDPSYEMGLTWSPRTYSVIDFAASQLFAEANGFGDAVERDRISVNWKHDWSDRLSTIVNVSRQDEDYGGTDREYTYDFYSVGVEYAFARWMDVKFEVIQDNRDTDIVSFDYDRPVIALGFVMSL